MYCHEERCHVQRLLNVINLLRSVLCHHLRSFPSSAASSFSVFPVHASSPAAPPFSINQDYNVDLAAIGINKLRCYDRGIDSRDPVKSYELCSCFVVKTVFHDN